MTDGKIMMSFTLKELRALERDEKTTLEWIISERDSHIDQAAILQRKAYAFEAVLAARRRAIEAAESPSRESEGGGEG